MSLKLKSDYQEVPFLAFLAEYNLNLANNLKSYDKEITITDKKYEYYDASITERMVRVGNDFDISKVTDIFKSIKPPQVLSYEMFIAEEQQLYPFERAKEYYKYTSIIGGIPMVINDLSVIADRMVINKDCVISRNKANPLESTKKIGFNSFYELVTSGETNINRWRITFRNSVFKVFYRDDKDNEFFVLEITNCFKELAYRYTLFIIAISAENADEYLADNFDTQILVWDH